MAKDVIHVSEAEAASEFASRVVVIEALNRPPGLALDSSAVIRFETSQPPEARRHQARKL